jgi:PAS domain S-box-containing protein
MTDDKRATARPRPEPEPQTWINDTQARLLVESVRDYAIFMLDPTGHVMTWNVGAERLKGYRASEIIGQRITRFYPEEENRVGKCELELETALREGRFEEEGWRIRKDGSRFWANVVLTAIFDATGHHIGFAKVTRDLTERKRMEEERLRLAQTQEALRLRDEFLSIASHELKTPITALQLQLHSLREQLAEQPPKVLNKIDRASRSSDRMAELIESLLDVSRISTGRFEMNLQRLDVSELLHEVTERLREAATRAGCELTIRADGAVSGTWDRLRIEQVVTNLLSNAIRYASHAPIEVTLAQEEDTAVIEVRDKGPGIPEEALSRIFERFERATGRSHHGGLGLGLYVVREIVKAHGGMATVRNVPGGGACFTIRLPLLPRAETRSEPTKQGELHA